MLKACRAFCCVTRMAAYHGSWAQQCTSPPKGFHRPVANTAEASHPDHKSITPKNMGSTDKWDLYRVFLKWPVSFNRWGNIATLSCLLVRARSQRVTPLAGILLACEWHYHLIHFIQFSLSPAKFFLCLEIWIKIWRYGLSSSIQVTVLDSVKSNFEIQEAYICNFPHLFFA